MAHLRHTRHQGSLSANNHPMERHNESRRLKWALTISLLYFFAELIAGFMTNSLALLSDAGHMLSDVGALGLSLFAFHVAKRPATHQSTYGFHRVEILAALFNGLTLWLIRACRGFDGQHGAGGCRPCAQENRRCPRRGCPDRRTVGEQLDGAAACGGSAGEDRRCAGRRTTDRVAEG